MTKETKEEIRTYAPVTSDTHERLTALAKARGISLYKLASAILQWAGDQVVQTLVGLGIRIPVYPGEFGPSDTQDS